MKNEMMKWEAFSSQSQVKEMKNNIVENVLFEREEGNLRAMGSDLRRVK